MTPTTCAQCANFIPDIGIRTMRDGTPYGNGSGVGECKLFNEFLAKNPSVSAIEKANKAMGGKLLYPNIERVCTKFEAK